MTPLPRLSGRMRRFERLSRDSRAFQRASDGGCPVPLPGESGKGAGVSPLLFAPLVLSQGEGVSSVRVLALSSALALAGAVERE